MTFLTVTVNITFRLIKGFYVNSSFALALHCLLLLAHYSDTMLTSSRLAYFTSVHAVRVRKILGLLKQEGYIDAKEGKNGGFFINCDIEKVHLDEIYRLTQKDVLNPRCHSCPDECKIGANIENLLIEIFSEADQNVQSFLKKHSLKSVLDQLYSRG